MTLDAKRLRKLCDAATPGPWQWFGNTKTRDVYLATIDRGRVFVMDFARWGMTGAQPRFQVRLGEGGGVMRGVGELGDEESPLGLKFEVSYRRQFVGIGHPDAVLIAAARSALPELLDENERLRAALDYLRRKIDGYDTTFHFAIRDERGENPISGFEDWKADE